MTVLPSNEQSTDWVGLAECPDCHSPLELREASLRCTACSREFRAVGAGYDLLPLGVESPADTAAPTGRGVRGSFIANVYTRHNRSRSVAQALQRVLSSIGSDEWGLNLGSADSQLHIRLLNLDVRTNDNIHVLGTAECLPFQDDSLCCVVSQEVLEHLPDFDLAVSEVARVLKPGGLFYVQVPFIIGFHSAPHDYWRFTHRGLEQVLRRAKFDVQQVAASVGPGTSLYRIMVEFVATLGASMWRKLYMPCKAAAALALWPLRWADWLMGDYGDTNRIAAGFYAIARKPGRSNPGTIQ